VVLAQADTDSTRLRAESQEQSLRRLVCVFVRVCVSGTYISFEQNCSQYLL
jgi:hypothetical protein